MSQVLLQCVANDLAPGMDKLEEEMKRYTKWQEACETVESLNHPVMACRFWRMLQHHKKHLASAEGAAQKLVDCDVRKSELEEELKLKQTGVVAAQNQLQLMSRGQVKEASARCDEPGLQVATQQGVVESWIDDVDVRLQTRILGQ
eukprot:jgi/Ulvmu1/8392/UM042_0099.1